MKLSHSGLSGFNIDLRLLGCNRRRAIQHNMFFIHVNSACNQVFFSVLISLAVIADENDFNKIVDKWNFKYNKFESRIREKNQLRYVAYTRAKEELYISENAE